MKVWEPEVSVAKWLSLHSNLKIILNSALCKCGLKPKPKQPLVIKNHVGIRCEACSCGKSGLRIFTLRNAKSKPTTNFLRALRGER